MIWQSLGTVGGLNIRPTLLFGLLAAALYLILDDRPRFDSHVVVVAAVIAGLVLIGVAANESWYQSGYWPSGETIRFVTNIALAVAISAILATADRASARVIACFISLSLVVSLGIYIVALDRSPLGLVGLVSALRSGNTRAVLFEAHLPALRQLHGSRVELGIRHGAVFGFITAVGFLQLMTIRATQPIDAGNLDVPRHPRRADSALRGSSAALSLTVTLLAAISLSRSAILALLLVGLAWLVINRADALFNIWIYAGGAALVFVGATSLAAGFGQRLFQDNASLASRQVNVGDVLASEWTIVGSPQFVAELDSPHNTLVEFAAAGGVLAFAAGLIIMVIAAFGVARLHRQSPPLTLLAVVVAVRLLSAGRGSLDSTALMALIAYVALAQPQSAARARTSWSPRWSASLTVT